jgi:hypothetical protein
MELNEAIRLLHYPDILKEHQTIWADLGSGSGLFTRALSNFLAPGSRIYAIDKHPGQGKRIEVENGIGIESITADFVRDSPILAPLDGILMANSLHYVSDKNGLIKKLNSWFAGDPKFLIVEYDMDQGPAYSRAMVPYPISFKSLKILFEKAGYQSIEEIAWAPSLYNREGLYSALIKK